MKKESLFAAIDQRQAEILSWGNAFFDCAELGFQEVKTAAAITALLDQWNIPYESGIAMTGIRVTLGSGSPHIAFVSDMDALPCKSKNGTTRFASICRFTKAQASLLDASPGKPSARTENTPCSCQNAVIPSR